MNKTFRVWVDNAEARLEPNVLDLADQRVREKNPGFSRYTLVGLTINVEAEGLTFKYVATT